MTRALWAALALAVTACGDTVVSDSCSRYPDSEGDLEVGEEATVELTVYVSGCSDPDDTEPCRAHPHSSGVMCPTVFRVEGRWWALRSDAAFSSAFVRSHGDGQHPVVGTARRDSEGDLTIVVPGVDAPIAYRSLRAAGLA